MKVVYEKSVKNLINEAIDKAKINRLNIDYIELTNYESELLLYELGTKFNLYPLDQESSSYNEYRYGGVKVKVLRESYNIQDEPHE